jgi:hypothetical protein
MKMPLVQEMPDVVVDVGVTDICLSSLVALASPAGTFKLGGSNVLENEPAPAQLSSVSPNAD